MHKVVHVVNDLIVGGVSSVLFDLVKNSKTSKFKYEIINLSGNYDESVISLFKQLEIKVHNLDYKFEPGYGLIDQYKKAIRKSKYRTENLRIIKYIANLEADILHFHTLPRELMLGREVNKIRRSILVFTDHSTRLKKSEMKKVSVRLVRYPFKQFYKNYHVIAVSSSVANYIKSFEIHKGLKSLTVITNKIPERYDQISYVRKTNINVVYVSRIFNGKGHPELMEAWAALGDTESRLYIIGPDNMDGKIQNLAEKLKISSDVIFTGSINNVKDFLKNMDIGVFPSHKEGLPLALLEKMQIGIPCVVSDIEELTAIVKDRQNGLVFKCGDVKDLQQKLGILIKDEQLRERLGIQAANTVKDVFVSKIDGLDQEYEVYYSNILKSGKG